MDETTPNPTPPASTPTDTFLGKLKEQSFSILVMVAVVYYQHTLWQADRARLEPDLTRKDSTLTAVVEAERTRLVEREKYLIGQRDQFIDMLKEQAAVCRMHRSLDGEE
jgi:hypothetical protein